LGKLTRSVRRGSGFVQVAICNVTGLLSVTDFADLINRLLNPTRLLATDPPIGSFWAVLVGNTETLKTLIDPLHICPASSTISSCLPEASGPRKWAQPTGHLFQLT